MNTINLVKKHLNKDLYIEGAFLTMNDAKNKFIKSSYKRSKKIFQGKCI